MTDFYTLLAAATGSISLIIGIISYYVGIKRGERTYRYFAMMALCLAAFLFLPPAGFIITDQPPYELNLLGKRVFIFVYYALFPWFIVSYTDFKNRLMPALISLWVIATYGLMYVAHTGSSMPVWLFFAIIALASILVLGLIAGTRQLKRTNSKTKWFLFAMIIFGLLLSLTTVNIFFPQLGVFFPLHTSSIPFMLIMGVHIAMDYMKSKPGAQ